MENVNKLDSKQLSNQLLVISTAVRNTVEICQGDTLALLALLRELEQLHRDVRENAFQGSLPDNRQKLYALLKDIESEGGWPYIERMRLQALLRNIELGDSSEQRDSTEQWETDRKSHSEK